MPSVELTAIAGVVFYCVSVAAWFALGPGSGLTRFAGVVLPLVGAAIIVGGILMLPSSMCRRSMWMPCLYRAFQFLVAYASPWPLGALARIVLHRAGSDPQDQQPTS